MFEYITPVHLYICILHGTTNIDVKALDCNQTIKRQQVEEHRQNYNYNKPIHFDYRFYKHVFV